MRVVIFTGNAGIESTPWWRVVCATQGIERILICLKTESRDPASLWRRQRRNIRKHGWIWLPYRILVLAASVIRRPFADRPAAPAVRCPIPCEHFEALDIHGADAIERVAEWRPDLGISIGAPILRPSLFRLPTRGTINLHLGKVPDYRGAPPAFWELYDGADEIGATVHWMDEGLDTGSVIVQHCAPLDAADSLTRVEAVVEELGRRALAEALGLVTAGSATGKPQPAGGSTNRQPTLKQRMQLAWRLTVRRWARRRANNNGGSNHPPS